MFGVNAVDASYASTFDGVTAFLHGWNPWLVYFGILVILTTLIEGIHWFFDWLNSTVTARRYRNADLDDVDQMEGHAFEEYVANRFRQLGFHALVTRRSGDFGADVILTNPATGERIAVQAKRYGEGENVGIAGVQEAHFGRTFYGCSRAIVITNRGFTTAARRGAEVANVSLLGREALRDLIQRARARENQRAA